MPDSEPLVHRLNEIVGDVLDLEGRLTEMVGDMREAHALLLVGKTDFARAKLNHWTELEDA